MKSKMFVLLVMSIFMVGCYGQQETVERRNEIIGTHSAESQFFEAQQISEIEHWKDNPNKIVNVYIINPVTGGLLIPPVQCKGVPASSTESLEPNEGHPVGVSSTTWRIQLDGQDVGTTEMAGRDGTFGDPVHFRQCMTVEGNYIDWPAYGVIVLVTSQSYTFPEATVQRDFETEARLLVAEEILERGGCINPETLLEIPCLSE